MSQRAMRLPLVAFIALALCACGDRGQGPGERSGSSPSGHEAAPPGPEAGGNPAAVGTTDAHGFIVPAADLMDELTGASFDAARACWPMTLGSGSSARRLCLRPGTPEWRPQAGSEQVFLHASHVPGDGETTRGAFAAIIAAPTLDGGLRTVARLKDFAVGEAGDCGCARARFRRLGKSRWGWVFDAREAGARRFHVLMASASGITPVAAMPVPEDGVDGLRHGVEFDASKENAETYDLLHLQLRGLQPFDLKRYPWDAAAGRYATPSGP